MKKVLVAITSVNLWQEYTKTCLNSLFFQNRDEFEVQYLLLDNGSRDETEQEASTLKLARHDFEVIRFNPNQGLQKAWNTILDYGFNNGFDYVFIGNNDTIYHPNTISHLMRALNNSQSDVVMVTAINIKGECPTPEAIYTIDETTKANLEANEHPDFSAFMVNKKFLDEVGYADEGFYPAFFEDNDLHRRIKMAGLRALNCPMAVYYHFGSGTQYNPKYQEGRVDGEKFAKNRHYYASKWGNIPGHETFAKPFNDSNKSVKWTKQNPV